MTNYTRLAEEIEELLEDPIPEEEIPLPEGRSQDEEDEDETSSDE